MVKTLPSRADHVGSLLRTEEIKQARIDYENGAISREDLTAIEDWEITKIVQKQMEVGLKSITDGEFRRAWWHLDFLSGLQGVEEFEAEYVSHFKGAKTKNKAIKVVGKVAFHDHYMINHFRFLKKAVDMYGDGSQEAKFSIPSPNMLFTRIQGDNYYQGNQDAFFDDTVKAYQQAIQAFYDEGCRYLQLDDTSWIDFVSPERTKEVEERTGMTARELIDVRTRCINEAIANKPEDMLITMHICRGNFRSTYITSGGYDDISDAIFSELNVDALFLEYDDERSGDFAPLAQLKRENLTIVLGLITSKFPELEEPEEVKKRIEAASEYVGIKQLALSPQCGFASTEEGNVLTQEDQWKKLRHVVEIAESVWG